MRPIKSIMQKLRDRIYDIHENWFILDRDTPERREMVSRHLRETLELLENIERERYEQGMIDGIAKNLDNLASKEELIFNNGYRAGQDDMIEKAVGDRPIKSILHSDEPLADILIKQEDKNERERI
jgi:hypothetical protein